MLLTELEIEERSIQNTLVKYKATKEKATELNTASTTQPVQTLIRNILDDVAVGVDKYLRGKKDNKGLVILSKLNISSADLAFAAIRCSINCVMNGTTKKDLVANNIGVTVVTEFEFRKMLKTNPAFVRSSINMMNDSGNKSARTQWDHLTRFHDKLGIERIPFSQQDKHLIGIVLLTILLQTCELFTKETHTTGRKKTTHLKLAEEAQSYIDKLTDIFAYVKPQNPIMVEEPLDWESLDYGGYYVKLPSIPRKFIMGLRKNAKEYIKQEHLRYSMHVVNQIQKVPWKINKQILEVVRQLWLLDNPNYSIAGLPPKEEMPRPPARWDNMDREEAKRYIDNNKDVYSKWARVARGIKKQNQAYSSQRFLVMSQIRNAEEYSQYDKIYFPHCVDFRGRVYPMPTGGVSPQGNDLGKALILYHRGQLLNERGLYWLKVHGANCHGEDKISFDERVKWVEKHEEKILMSAQQPLEMVRWWEKADKPFQFLSFCFEYLRMKQEGMGKFLTFLPIPVDGSCNGLQHLSALVSDEEGCRSVNVIGSEDGSISDVYSVIERKTRQSLLDKANTTDDLDERGMCLLCADLTTRKVVKRPAMTTAYSVTKLGIVEQIRQEIKTKTIIKDAGYTDQTVAFKLGSHCYDAIQDTIKASKSVMDWLKQCAHLLSDAGEYFRYVNKYTGFHMVQAYDKGALRRVNLRVCGEKLALYNFESIGTPKKSKQKMAVSPNFIHSMDASALLCTADALYNEGIQNMSFIHDSYSVSANDVDKLNKILREVFYNIYKDKDVLIDLHKQLEELGVELPPPPEQLGADLSKVLDSKYFFA